MSFIFNYLKTLWYESLEGFADTALFTGYLIDGDEDKYWEEYWRSHPTEPCPKLPRPCQACGHGTINHHYRQAPVEFRGRKGEIRMQSGVCDHCGGDFADAQDMAQNLHEWTKFKRETK
jgi:hypothetical protein